MRSCLLFISSFLSLVCFSQVDPHENWGADSTHVHTYETHCTETFYSEADIAQAAQAVQQSLNDPNLSDSSKERLAECLAELEQRVAVIRASYNSSEAPSDTVLVLLREAERNEQEEKYRMALSQYKSAFDLRPTLWVADKIEELKSKVKLQQLTRRSDSLAEVQRVRDVKNYVPLNGIFTSALYYGAYDYSNTQGLEGVSTDGLSFYMSLDYNFGLVESGNLGLHLGASVSFGNPLVPAEGTTSAGGSYSMDPLQWDLGAFFGLNVHKYVELDLYIRGLSIYGYYDYTSSDGGTVLQEPFGGAVHYDGGLRASVYFLRRARYNLRITGWYVDTRDGSPIGFLNFSDAGDPQTYSLGYRIEYNMEPWAFHFFHSSDAYYPSDGNLNIGLTTWGIGLGYGFGFQ